MISKNKLKYVRSLEMKKYRKAEGVFVAEGHKLVGDLLDVFECKYLAATSEWLSANAAWVECQRRSGVEVDEVTDEELKRASFQETPQQVLAVFKQLTYEVDVNEVARKQLCLVLDDVQNPGNLGTIVRLADWFGIEHIFCSKGCADIYNPKTVQATMGGIARVQVHEADLPELLSRLDKDIPVYGTFLDGENIYGKELENRGLIVMGNEGKGVSKEVAAFVTERLYIPNYPEGRETSESLNVAIATAIVCAEFRRR
jgi:TrmH family RNA methyltransferase